MTGRRLRQKSGAGSAAPQSNRRASLPSILPSSLPSILGRALLGIVLTEAACMLLLAGVAIWHERGVRLRAADVLVEGRADSLFGAIQDAEDVGDNVTLEERELQLPKEDAFAVFDGRGQLLATSKGAPAGLIRQPEEPGWRTERWDGHRYRVLRRNNIRVIDRAQNGGHGLERPVEILYAVRIDRIWQEIFAGVGFFLGASLVLILCTIVVMAVLVRFLLRPIDELAEAAGAVSVRHLRFNTPADAMRTRELQPLAAAMATMVGGLRDAFERQHRFLGDATHELKTAAAVVRSSLQVMLLRGRTAEEYRAGLEQAVRDNERVEVLISRMLLLARLDETRSPVHAQCADLGRAVRASMEHLHSLAERADVRMVLSSAQTGVSVGIAATDLEVLAGNLLVNAIEHSGAGSVVLLEMETAGKQVRFSVADNGCGIPETALPHLFERFYRVDISRSRTTGGAGLGLAIVKAIVDGAGGEIEVTSRPGQGTRVTVSLPIVGAVQPAEETVAETPHDVVEPN